MRQCISGRPSALCNPSVHCKAGSAGTPNMAGLAVATVAQPAEPVTRKRKQEVLDEDEWTSLLEEIIARDFFPDVPKLQSKLEWLQASFDWQQSLPRPAAAVKAELGPCAGHQEGQPRPPQAGTDKHSPAAGWAAHPCGRHACRLCQHAAHTSRLPDSGSYAWWPGCRVSSLDCSKLERRRM